MKQPRKLNPFEKIVVWVIIIVLIVWPIYFYVKVKWG
jgi:hypothetical protein